MDIFTPDKDGDSPQVSRDSRKTKQLLLELEAIYGLFLKAEDINNPHYVTNMEKLREIKQKQRYVYVSYSEVFIKFLNCLKVVVPGC